MGVRDLKAALLALLLAIAPAYAHAPGQPVTVPIYVGTTLVGYAQALKFTTGQFTCTLGAGGVITCSAGGSITQLGACIGESTDICSTGLDLTGKSILLPTLTTLVGADCDDPSEYGREVVKTDATTDKQVYICTSAGWVAQGSAARLAYIDVAAAGCTNDTVANAGWDLRGSSVPSTACVTGGTNGVQTAVLDFDAAADECVSINFRLRPDADPSLGFDVIYDWFSNAATSGAVGWCSQFACVAAGESIDPAYPAHSTSNCVSATTAGTAQRLNQTTDTSVTNTGCAAGEEVYWRVCRDGNGSTVTDDMANDARLKRAILAYRYVTP